LPTDDSSAPRRKRARSAIAAHRRRSALIGPGPVLPAGLAEAFGHLVGIEAKARPAAPAEAARTQLVGVVVDPAASDAPPPRDLLGGDELGAGSRLLPQRQQLGEATRQRLDRFGIETKCTALIPLAHRRLPKGPRRTFGFLEHCREWCAMRAAAISI
jgi:hypothetical protein